MGVRDETEHLTSILRCKRAYDHGQVDQSFYEMYCQDIASASTQFGWAEDMKALLSNFPEEAKMQIFASLYR